MSNDPCYPHEWKLEMWIFYKWILRKKLFLRKNLLKMFNLFI